jgi:hypothetical protein
MPSPLAHTAAGFAIHDLLQLTDEKESEQLGVAILFSLLPDADSLLGLAAQDFARFHNNISHSLGFAVGAGVLSGIGWGWRKGLFWRYFSTGMLAYCLHLGLDYWATRRGILLFWPISERRFVSPIKLFYGFQWGRGVWSMTHLWTALTESLFGLSLFVWMHCLRKRIAE